ncbi:MAG: Crp/Fnr family transcriptional regulator [Bacteroidetes bacterium]|nr:Crp/Fnr family transcriptional regulator [Bacteroidota bacterium]MBS1933011.1 Crp/Fnr family transcriptional regulator [Bacteroidota bacterium]
MASENLLIHIRKFVPLSKTEEELLLPYLKNISLKKKEHILKEGQICTANYFVVKGCMRMYFITEQGTEQIVQFAIDNWWLADLMSLDAQKPSQFNIQAIEATEVIALDKNIQEELFTKVPKMERYFRIILQKAFAASVMRFRYIFTQSGEERFHHFITSFPDFVQRVPQYMLASYLGFSAEFLSKLRAKKNI